MSRKQESTGAVQTWSVAFIPLEGCLQMLHWSRGIKHVGSFRVQPLCCVFLHLQLLFFLLKLAVKTKVKNWKHDVHFQAYQWRWPPRFCKRPQIPKYVMHRICLSWKQLLFKMDHLHPPQAFAPEAGVLKAAKELIHLFSCFNKMVNYYLHLSFIGTRDQSGH